MVEKFKKILSDIESAKGKVAIFALLKMDEFVDKWTVVFSASWANDTNRDEIFQLIRKETIDNLTAEEVAEIARIAIFPKTEHFIEELLQYQAGTKIENRAVNGNKVHYAEIIKSDKEA